MSDICKFMLYNLKILTIFSKGIWNSPLWKSFISVIALLIYQSICSHILTLNIFINIILIGDWLCWEEFKHGKGSDYFRTRRHFPPHRFREHLELDPQGRESKETSCNLQTMQLKRILYFQNHTRGEYLTHWWWWSVHSTL